MTLHLTGLGLDDIAEVVDCLILGAEEASGTDGETAAHRLSLAHRIGDALEELPSSP